MNSDRPVTLKYIPERLLLTDQGSGLILFVSRTLMRLKINQILLLPNFTNLLESNQLRKFKSMITVTLTKIKWKSYLTTKSWNRYNVGIAK